MDLHLIDKVAIVTGGSRGIGKAIANGLGAEGCRVAICARDISVLEQTAGELLAAGIKVLPVAADLTRAEDPARVVEVTVGTFGRIDILVNNVGGARAAGAFLETPDFPGGRGTGACRRIPRASPASCSRRFPQADSASRRRLRTSSPSSAPSGPIG